MTCKRQILWAAALLVLLAAAPAGCREPDRKAKEAAVVELQGPGPERHPGGSHRHAVRTVLKADKALSERFIQVRYPDPIQWRDGHLAYAREMNAISVEGTPRGFADAFRRHQAAWDTYAAFLAPIPTARLGVLLEGGAAGRPEDAALVDQARALNEDISSTWAAVETEARAAGAGRKHSRREPPAPVGSPHKLLGTRRSEAVGH
jgi:hypothetical protein